MQVSIGIFRRELFPIILSLQSAIRMACNRNMSMLVGHFTSNGVA